MVVEFIRTNSIVHRANTTRKRRWKGEKILDRFRDFPSHAKKIPAQNRQSKSGHAFPLSIHGLMIFLYVRIFIPIFDFHFCDVCVWGGGEGKEGGGGWGGEGVEA